MTLLPCALLSRDAAGHTTAVWAALQGQGAPHLAAGCARTRRCFGFLDSKQERGSRAAFGSPLNRLWLSAAREPVGVPRDAKQRSAHDRQVQASKCACDKVPLTARRF